MVVGRYSPSLRKVKNWKVFLIFGSEFVPLQDITKKVFEKCYFVLDDHIKPYVIQIYPCFFGAALRATEKHGYILELRVNMLWIKKKPANIG